MRVNLDVPKDIKAAMGRASCLGQGKCVVLGDFNNKHEK